MKKKCINHYYKIENTDKKEIYYVYNLEKFCREHKLTKRLLYYTNPKHKDREVDGHKVRWQPYHKGYKIVEKVYKYMGLSTKQNIKNGIYFQEFMDWYSPLTEVKEVSIDKENKVVDELDTNIVNEIHSESNSKDSVVIELHKTMKKLQKERDKLTLLRKIVREESRQDTKVEELKDFIKKELRNIKSNSISEKDFDKIELKVENRSRDDSEGIVCLSDIHIGKTVDLKNNQYNLDIAYDRLEKLALKIMHEVLIYKIGTLHICLLGDLIHARHRRDMKATSEFQEIESGIQCYKLLRNFIDTLRSFLHLDIKIYSIVGNESRFESELPHTNIEEVSKNSLDYLVYTMLQEHYVDTPNIEFMSKGYGFEEVFTVKDKTIAIIHGDKINHSKLNTEIPKLKLRLHSAYGKLPDYIFMGHIHSSIVTDAYARNSSLVGADDYATIGLNIPESQISQLFGVVSKFDNNILRVFSLKLD